MILEACKDPMLIFLVAGAMKKEGFLKILYGICPEKNHPKITLFAGIDLIDPLSLRRR